MILTITYTMDHTGSTPHMNHPTAHKEQDYNQRKGEENNEKNMCKQNTREQIQ